MLLDPLMEGMLIDTPSLSRVARIEMLEARISAEITILIFCHHLGIHYITEQILDDEASGVKMFPRFLRSKPCCRCALPPEPCLFRPLWGHG